ncbi:hypothetical protein QE400_000497 [Xanthomonas sacchari]|uniref:hypothetical protein n=1 Tax=Xanthomonas sacchari TaxID=56458 RepID=UPI00278BA87F|nr:hypothetical protein [Xanthomonas sacchari]MDQ1091084.1 hypothetical protein [Xanthomonas sacchari]
MSLKMMGLLLAIAASCFSYEAHAAMQVFSAGKITYVENGWDGEGMAIHTSNDGPSGCSALPNDFAIDKNHPAYKELTALALAAYTSNTDVELLVDSGVCIFGNRTKVISIRLKK